MTRCSPDTAQRRAELAAVRAAEAAAHTALQHAEERAARARMDVEIAELALAVALDHDRELRPDLFWSRPILRPHH